MPVTIHCIRHGQGLHNVGAGFYNLPDPLLTPEGEAQCRKLRETRFSNLAANKISLIATSPMTRAIQSAYIIFQPLLQNNGNTKLLAVPDAQETSDDPCDIGSDIPVLKETCAKNNWPVDLSLLKDGWNDKHSPGARYAPSTRAIERRARDLRTFLRGKGRELIAKTNDDDVQIVLVAHGGFMHYFSGDWEEADKYPATGWVNCEMRSYTFLHGVPDDTEDEDENALLVESMESRTRRGLDHPMYAKEKQREFYEKAMQGWEDQGLQNPSKFGLVNGEHPH